MSKVTVIIPNFNHAAYLQQRLDSIINQTFQDFEIVILDDCSTDDSKTVIEKYRSHPKVTKIVYNEVNSGSTFRQWNKGIAIAKGELIWIAESDDVAAPHLLQHLVEGLTVNQEAVISYCQSYRMNSNGQVTGSWKDWTDDLNSDKFAASFFMNGIEFIETYLIKKNVLPNASGILFSKQAFLEAGGADVEIRYCADWLLWLKMLTKGNVFFCAQHLNYFRYHQKSVIATAIKDSLFYNKFTVFMRIAFSAFLKKEKKHNNKKLSKLNKVFISKEAFEESLFYYSHNEYADTYLFLKIGIHASVKKATHIIEYLKELAKITKRKFANSRKVQ